MRLNIKYLHFLSFLLVLCSFSSYSQQMPVHNQFFLNPYAYNPAMVGIHNYAEIFITRRKQWLNHDDSPVTTTFSLQVPSKKKVSFGVFIYQDKLNSILSNTNFMTTFGYTVPFGYDHNLKFGISAGFGQIAFDMSELEDQAQDLPTSGSDLMESHYHFDGQFGLNYHNQRFNLGFALPKLFETPLRSEKQFDDIYIERLQKFLFHTSYRFTLIRKTLEFEPNLLYYVHEKKSKNAEILSSFYINDVIWAGGSYKLKTIGDISSLKGQSATVFTGLKINDRFRLSYSYEHSFSSNLGGSHEILFGARIGKKIKQPKKFIRKPLPKVEQAKAQIQAQPKRQFKEAPLERTNNSIIPYYTEQIVPKESTVRVRQDRKFEFFKRGDEEEDETTQPQVIKEKVTVVGGTTEKEEIEQQVETPQKPVKNEVKIVVVTKGESSNENELKVGNYVVLGVFSIVKNAEKYVDYLNKKGFDAAYGYNSNKKLYYVYIFYDQFDLERAKKERGRIVRQDEFAETWILTVK